jgi:tRNA threonylcarbamoyladenosine biosynthesis protein TsaE
MKEIIINSISEIDKAAKEFLNVYKNETVFAFYGEMGAGKTTLIKSICAQLEVVDTVNSPTFSLINEYYSSNDETLYHFDFYRVESTQEAKDIGCEDYFYSGNLCLIEWPEKIEAMLPENVVKINIEVLSPESRKIIFN